MRFDPRRMWALLVGVLSVAIFPALVSAQSLTGSIYGQAESGATVVIKNTGTGATRELPADAGGGFTFSTVTPGTYTVSMKKGGVETESRQVVVVAGIGSSVNFGAPAEDVVQLEKLVVGGSIITPIDVSTAQTSMVYSAQRMEQIPVPKDIISVALLAPGTTRGDAAFGNLASFGGSSVAENAYYVNGFNVTNLFKNLAYSQVPFYAISEEQVITGSYGPEYGLSTGGVVNLTTKKGTNTWQVGGAITHEPDALREQKRKTYTNQFEAYRDYSDTSKSVSIYDVWAGGPIIQDTLFVYGIVEYKATEQDFEPRSYEQARNFERLDQKDPFALVNVTYNITDSHSVGFTFINDTREQDFDEGGSAPDAQGFSEFDGTYLGTDHFKEGGSTFIANYTGYLTDNLTLTAQGGVLNSKREQYQNAADGTRISYNGVVGDFNQPGCPLVITLSSWTTYNGVAAPNTCFLTTTVDAETSEDDRTAGRVDLEYRLASHALKGGVEIDQWSSKDGTTYSGGTYYRYANRDATDPNAGRGADNIQGTADDSNIVRVRHFQTGADIDVNTEALYLKDNWQVTDTLLLSLGVRSDSFENLNGAGVAYAKQDNIIQPRLGAAWDVAGDAKQKLYATYGIYSLPIAATVAVRAASASIFSQQNFSYTAIDPTTGAATLGAPTGALVYLNAESGVTPNPKSVATKDLDPTLQNEFVLGYQAEVGAGWTAGVRGTFRDLDTTIDDMCDSRPFEQWAADNGYTYNPAADTPGCFIINPGKAMDIEIDIDDDGTRENVHLSPEMIGLPEIERTYYSLEFTAEKTASTWFTQASYTWAHNYGNAEGLVKSDIGQDDTGVTQDFDAPELMIGANGNLPNDRRHSFKATGGYKWNQELWTTVGFLLQSGRPQNCFGQDVNDANTINYGASYLYCGGQRITRGSAGTNPWEMDLDLGVTYQPHQLAGLTLQAKVFNVLDLDAITAIDEGGENSTGAVGPGDPRSGYKATRDYQTPRFFQFTVRYDFSL